MYGIALHLFSGGIDCKDRQQPHARQPQTAAALSSAVRAASTEGEHFRRPGSAGFEADIEHAVLGSTGCLPPPRLQVCVKPAV